MHIRDIVYVATLSYVPMAIASMVSVNKSSNVGPLTFHLIYFDSDANGNRTMMARISRYARAHSMSLRLYNLNDYTSDNMYIRAVVRMPPPVWRIVIPDIIDAKVVLYLDNDTLAVGALNELFLSGIRDCVVCARLDTADLCKYFLNHKESSGISPTSPYFNSGVLLWNLEESRITGDVEHLVNGMLQNWHECFTYEYPQGDQAVLNIVFYDRWELLSNEYNCFVRDALYYNPKILHYIGDTKPWSFRTPYKYSLLYWRELLHTPFPAWRLFDFSKRLLTQVHHTP